MYDLAQKLSHMKYGWLIILGFMSASPLHYCLTFAPSRIGRSDSHDSVPVLISFPPMIGHTTTVTLCGFAYGMNGFLRRFGWIRLGGRHGLRRFEVPVFETASEVVRHE
jgi:hypothetical protein